MSGKIRVLLSLAILSNCRSSVFLLIFSLIRITWNEKHVKKLNNWNLSFSSSAEDGSYHVEYECPFAHAWLTRRAVARSHCSIYFKLTQFNCLHGRMFCISLEDNFFPFSFRVISWTPRDVLRNSFYLLRFSSYSKNTHKKNHDNLTVQITPISSLHTTSSKWRLWLL